VTLQTHGNSTITIPQAQATTHTTMVTGGLRVTVKLKKIITPKEYKYVGLSAGPP